LKRVLKTRKQQTGAVAIMVGLSILVLIMFLGIVVDLGRMYVTKTELSNAADACALAAASQLTGGPNSVTLAQNAGELVGDRNNVSFQSTAVNVQDSDIAFSDHLNGTYYTAAEIAAGAANPANMKYAKCTLPRTGIIPYFMQVAGFGPQTVASLAVATLAPGLTTCGLPIGMCDESATVSSCADGSTPQYGLCKTNWYCSVFSNGQNSGGACPNSVNPTGNFNLIDYCPPQSTCIDTGHGGAPAMADLLAGSGQCGLNIDWKVGATGLKFGPMQAAWNTRFGITPPPGQIANGFTPDFSGFAYSPSNWPRGTANDPATYPSAYPDVYAGTSASTTVPPPPNFQSAETHSPPYAYQNNTGTWPDGFTVNGNLTIVTGNASRRIAIVPIMDCTGWGSGQVSDIKAFACILMLHPWADKWTGTNPNNPPLYLEYLGLSTDPGSPCASTGLPGGPGSVGPMVPKLVR
jgi:hypothetical protein